MDAPVSVTGVTANPTSLSVEVGKTGTFTYAVQPDNATDKSVAVKSSDDTIATVSDKAGTVTVTGVKAGTGKVTGTTTDGSKTFEVTLTVTAPA
ncbi:Ig-like domain-containing protein [Lapidilactobacillus bayanensis]|uniref:Ig-like domain-containing protein n=1 Tax=Lapidilactobacillus bayanensis TaxID=2485998 RepID=UPI000F76CF79|nr:Ig-like domain-containing protein [Lapidilactobacillus bayanensis]